MPAFLENNYGEDNRSPFVVRLWFDHLAQTLVQTGQMATLKGWIDNGMGWTYTGPSKTSLHERKVLARCLNRCCEVNYCYTAAWIKLRLGP